MTRGVFDTLLVLAVLILTLVPVGTAVFVLGFVYGDSPCVVCWQERTAMMLIALLGLFVLRYGPRPRYLGLSILVAAWGIFMSLRHTAGHAMRDIGQGFSIELLGAHTYTWALVIFWVAILFMGGLLLLLRERDLLAAPRAPHPLARPAMVAFLIVTAANILQAFASTGPPPYMGQSDPVRFSFDPSHWIWSLEKWRAMPITLRGDWAIAKPDIGTPDPDPAAGPLLDPPVLTVESQRRLTLPLRGTPTDLAYDAATDRFLLTTQNGVYVADGMLEHLERHTVVDPAFAVDLGRFSGAAFLDSRTMIASGENKSYVILRSTDTADADRNFRFFLESFDRFDEVSRSRLATIRARMMYIMSLAYDPVSDSLYTVSVPNAQVKHLILSRFDRRDMTLSEEFTPDLAREGSLRFNGETRSLAELFVTAATITNRRLYALSAAYNLLLAIDLDTRSAVAAAVIPGLVRPVGIALKGEYFWILSEDGTLSVVSGHVVLARRTGDLST